MNDLRIAFMGTPDFAVASLKALLDNGFRIVAVVTAPDRPAGRGRKLRASAVKEYARQQGLPVLQPPNLKAPDFLDSLRDLGVNLQVVVAFRMLPRQVWEFPRFGTFNLHASLLPDYRGAAPINWALINGEQTTGVTTFFIDEQIDTGNIIMQETIQIGPGETAGELHDRLMETGASLVVETVRRIASGPVDTQSQKNVHSPKAAPKLYREDCRVRWDRKAADIFNQIRGLSPYPTAWSRLQNGETALECKIFRSRLTNREKSGPGGTLEIEEKCLFVNTADSQLELLEIQPEGKRRMHVADWLNGVAIEKSARFV